MAPLLALLLTLTAATGAAAQTPPDRGVTVIHAGRLFDSARGEFVADRDIIVRGTTVESVGQRLPVPPGARVIDLSGYTVLPGLIDAHTHLLYLEQPGQGLTSELIRSVVVEGTALRALHGAARARTFLAAGITTVRDLGNSGRFGDVALRTAINDGSVDGPRMIVSGPGLSAEGGQLPGVRPEFAAVTAEEYRIVKGPVDAAQAVRENVTYGAMVIKIYSDNTPNRALLSTDEMKAIVAEAHLLGLKVSAHATSDRAVWRATDAGVDGIEHAYEVADSTLALMKRKGTVLVPTDADTATLRVIVSATQSGTTLTPAQLAQYLSGQHERLRRAVAAGVTIAAGSDMYLDVQVPQGEAAKRVLTAYAEAGLTPLQILQAATVNAAALLGLEKRAGVIQPGSFADIIAVEGDPETDIGALGNVRFVMKAGTVYRQEM